MFSKVRDKMQAAFALMVADGGKLFTVNPDRDKIWEVYLDAFKEEDRQGNRCSCCKQFLRSFGGIVSVKNNKMLTLWDFIAEDEEYNDAIKALKDYVNSLRISGIFRNDIPKCGVEKNADPKAGVVWNHFYLKLPNEFVLKDSGSVCGEARANKDVLQRSLNEITDDAIETVVEICNQGSIYRGNEFVGMVKEFKKIKEEYKKIKNTKEKENFCWTKSQVLSPALCKIRNSAVGTLLNDLSEGRELDSAVTAYEKIMAPSSYKRTSSPVSAAMINKAKARLEELGLTECLHRRLLTDKDLNVNNALFVDRPKAKSLDIFDELVKDVAVNPKTLSKVEEISIKDFVDKVLPTAKSVSVLVENRHAGNFVTLVGPQEESGDTLFKWGNNFSWSYAGAVADSMRAQVQALGGRVDGVLRFTHSWNHPEAGRNTSLMDLHVFLPGSSGHKDGCHDGYPSGQRVGWNNRNDHASGGSQDVDYVNAAPEGHIPLENISFPDIKKLKDGKYIFKIHNWEFRNPTKSGFRAEIEFGGEIFHYNHPAPLKNKEWVTLAEVTLKNGVFTIEHKMESKTSSQNIWGVNTERFHKVKAITLSPNFWTNKIGNKHYFFFLEGCESDGEIRGFYNEMLKEELKPDRKVFEILGSKILVEKTEKELAGLGFSDTLRNTMFVSVEGAFKRNLKIVF